MSDETTEQNETPEEQAPEAVEETAAAVADEPVAEAETEAAEPAEAPEAAAPAEPAEPVEVVHPKVRRKRERGAHTGEARPSRTPEERQEQRLEERKAKAVARSRRRQQERAKKAALPNGEGTPPTEHEPGIPQTRQGIVVSEKADKTITVRIDTAKRHPRYQKIVRSTKTLHAHDESNDAHEGDVVRVVECRPMSRLKRWRLVEILERAK